MSPNNKPNNLTVHASETINLTNLPFFFHLSKKLLLKQISCKNLRLMKHIICFLTAGFLMQFFCLGSFRDVYLRVFVSYSADTLS